MTIRIWMTGALAGAALLTASASASAQDCTTDEDCGQGLTCVVYTDYGCPEVPPCEDGEDCPDFDDSDCEEREFGSCEPVPVDCTSDSDCDGDFVCVEFTYETCSGVDVPAPLPAPEPGGSDSGSDDAPDRGEPGAEEDPEGMPEVPEDDECEEVTEAYCVPPYVAPCDSDAACGAGFDCVEVEACECSGGGSTGSAGGGSGSQPPIPGEDPDEEGEDRDEDSEAPAPDRDGDEDPGFEPDVDCSCSGTGEFYCQPEEVSCESSADCAAEWTCEAAGDTVCTFDAATGEESCEESESYCFPPNWDVWSGAAGGGSSDDLAVGGERVRDEGGANGGEEGAPSADDARRPIEEGCAAAAAPATASWALMMLGLFGLRRRR